MTICEGQHYAARRLAGLRSKWAVEQIPLSDNCREWHPFSRIRLNRSVQLIHTWFDVHDLKPPAGVRGSVWNSASLAVYENPTAAVVLPISHITEFEADLSKIERRGHRALERDPAGKRRTRLESQRYSREVTVDDVKLRFAKVPGRRS